MCVFLNIHIPSRVEPTYTFLPPKCGRSWSRSRTWLPEGGQRDSWMMHIGYTWQVVGRIDSESLATTCLDLKKALVRNNHTVAIPAFAVDSSIKPVKCVETWIHCFFHLKAESPQPHIWICTPIHLPWMQVWIYKCMCIGYIRTVSTDVCMYVRMYACTCGWVYGGWKDTQIHGCVFPCIHASICVSLSICLV